MPTKEQLEFVIEEMTLIRKRFNNLYGRNSIPYAILKNSIKDLKDQLEKLNSEESKQNIKG